MSQNGGISRRKIVMSQSQVALNLLTQEPESDVWTDRETLFTDHLKEVLDKWSDIDDEIWGKIICMERNRRVAKAYCRVPVLTVNGTENGFDGYRIGLNGFDNPKRQKETQEIKAQIGEGIKIKMDHEGNIFLKKMSPVEVYIKGTGENLTKESCLSMDLLKIEGQLELNKPAKVFDMKRFTQNIANEMKGDRIDRQKLELQCIVNICLGPNQKGQLEAPCWLMLINIVAMDMLRNQLPEEEYEAPRPMQLRTPALMENVSETRYMSTPRDEHYPKLARAQRTNSVLDLSLGQVTDYGTVGYAKKRQMTEVPTNYYPYLANQYQMAMEHSAQYPHNLQSFQAAQQKFFPELDYRKWNSNANLLNMSGQRLQKASDWE